MFFMVIKLVEVCTWSTLEGTGRKKQVCTMAVLTSEGKDSEGLETGPSLSCFGFVF